MKDNEKVSANDLKLFTNYMTNLLHIMKHAVTGAPGLPFPTVSSEVVSQKAGLQKLFTMQLPLWESYFCACLHRSL